MSKLIIDFTSNDLLIEWSEKDKFIEFAKCLAEFTTKQEIFDVSTIIESILEFGLKNISENDRSRFITQYYQAFLNKLIAEDSENLEKSEIEDDPIGDILNDESPIVPPISSFGD